MAMTAELTRKPAVKAMDSQRWICRIVTFQFMGSPLGCALMSSVGPGQELFQVAQELLPPGVRAAERLLLVGPETRLFHPQMRAFAGGRQREGDDALQAEGRVLVVEVPG